MAKTKSTTIEVLEIPVNEILPDPDQPRQSFDEDGNLELAKSVAKDGILQPILIRPIDGKAPLKYMVVFGHRRLWAAKKVNLKTIPARVKDLTPEEALHIQVIENLQRKNINPMDEADAFSRLITKNITTAEQIGDELGVSTKYVYDRLALKKVIEPVQDLIRQGKLTLSHGKQFARLKTEDQEKLWENWASNIEDDDLSIGDLKREISNSFSLKLENAIFSTSDGRLIPKVGSCDKCQKRSGCNLLLFDDIQHEDICFDKNCYNQKEKAHAENVIKHLEREGKKVVRIASRYFGGVDLPAGVIAFSDWEACSEKNAHAIGVVVVSNRNSYPCYKVGEHFPVRLSSIQDDDNEQEDSIEDSESTSQRTVDANRSFVDHDQAISLLLWEEIIEKYKTAADFKANITEILKDNIYKLLKRLDQENLERLCQLNGFEVVKDGDGDILDKNTIDAIINNSDDLPRLYLLVDLVNYIDPECTYFDKDFVEELRPKLAIAGIDIDAIISEYSESTEGAYTLPD